MHTYAQPIIVSIQSRQYVRRALGTHRPTTMTLDVHTQSGTVRAIANTSPNRMDESPKYFRNFLSYTMNEIYSDVLVDQQSVRRLVR